MDEAGLEPHDFVALSVRMTQIAMEQITGCDFPNSQSTFRCKISLIFH